MKLVLVHGQNHKGSTYRIARMLAGYLAKEEEITEFFLPRDFNHFCIGCYQCLEDDAKCPFYEEKRKITEAVEEADVLIFTTPTYALRVSAPMKSFLDVTFTYWMVHRPRKCMFSKKAVVISTAAGGGTRHAAKDVAVSLEYWGVPWIRCYGCALRAVSLDAMGEKKKAAIKRDLQHLADKIKKKKPKVGIKTRAIFYMMRMMHAHGLSSSEAEKKYWTEQGWLGKARPWKA